MNKIIIIPNNKKQKMLIFFPLSIIALHIKIFFASSIYIVIGNH